MPNTVLPIDVQVLSEGHIRLVPSVPVGLQAGTKAWWCCCAGVE